MKIILFFEDAATVEIRIVWHNLSGNLFHVVMFLQPLTSQLGVVKIC